METTGKRPIDDLHVDAVPRREKQKKALTGTPEDVHDFDTLTRIYYKNLFPFDLMFDWLSYGEVSNMHNRELSYTLNIQGDEIYARYKVLSAGDVSYDSAEAFRAAITKENPIKIDIGAIYPCPPEDRSSIGTKFMPLEREFVFDIDLTDYDEIRFCCQGAKICNKCWGLMVVAVDVVDRRLRNDFGFQHILWVYSGRRGVHCWVADAQARALAADARLAIVRYMTLVDEKADTARKVSLPMVLHPMVEEIYERMLTFFVEEYMEEQELFTVRERWLKVLELIPNRKIAAELDHDWSNETGPGSNKRRFEQMKKTIEAKTKSASLPRFLIMEIIIQFTYPRFDAAVSLGMNHLLKSPFVVHPKTLRVCVPIDAANVNDFRFEKVPTVDRLVQELNEPGGAHEPVADSEDDDADRDGEISKWRHTSLAPYIKQFKAFLRPLQKATRAQMAHTTAAGNDMEDMA